MSRTDSPNQIRPLRGSIPAVCPERSDRSCCCWYSAHICLASAEFAFAHISGVSFTAHALHRPAVQAIFASSSYRNTTARSQRPTLHNSLQSARRAPCDGAQDRLPPLAKGIMLNRTPGAKSSPLGGSNRLIGVQRHSSGGGWSGRRSGGSGAPQVLGVFKCIIPLAKGD